MSSGAHVAPAVIDDVARALVHYAMAEESAMQAVESAIRQATDRAQSEQSRRISVLHASEAALRACLAIEDADCTTFHRAVKEARADVDAARQALLTINSAVGRYQPTKSRHQATVQALVQNGRARLNRNAHDIQTYLASGGGSGASGGYASGPMGGGTSSSVSAADTDALSTPAGFPAGWAMVPVSAIDVSDSGVKGAADFRKGYSPEDLAWAFGALHDVVIPAMAMGKSGDYFADRDARENLSGTRSYHMTWSQFFGDGSDAIRLDRQPDGRYTVDNGYHRIFVAQQGGESVVPAKVHL